MRLSPDRRQSWADGDTRQSSVGVFCPAATLGIVADLLAEMPRIEGQIDRVVA
jgi:hypothetical protein